VRLLTLLEYCEVWFYARNIGETGACAEVTVIQTAGVEEDRTPLRRQEGDVYSTAFSPLALQTDHTNSVRQEVVECCCGLWTLSVCYRHNHTNPTPGTSSSVTCTHPTFCCLVTSLFCKANVAVSIKSTAICSGRN